MIYIEAILQKIQKLYENDDVMTRSFLLIFR
jgi:hypothetical protein